MNEGKTIDGNMSSIVDLKAELYRKQESFRLKKLSESQRQVIEDNNNLYSIHNLNQIKYKLGKRVREKSEREVRQKRGHTSLPVVDKTEELAEEEKALKKSRQMLEMKSQLYDKWSKNPDLLNANKDTEDLNEDIDDRILVDFHRKSYNDSRTEMRPKDEDVNEMHIKAEAEEEEEEWTEFVDSLGRSRKCLKKDLQHYKDIDRQSFHKNTSSERKSDIPSVPELSSSNELLSDDLRREIERRNWETNATNELKSEEPESDSLNVHYQNVKRNEIRDHGVAYYAFSEDQQTRQQQMDLLNELREQTKTRKIQKQNLKQKRKQLLRERLAKVAQRKGIAVEFKESSSDSEEEVDEVVPVSAPEPRPVPTSVREWDVGKDDMPRVLPDMVPKPKPNLYNNYVEERRTERNPDFAPPSAYNRKQFRDNSIDNNRHFGRQTPQMNINCQKPINISHNCDDIIDNNKCSVDSVNTDSNRSAPEDDISVMIGSALSYFRNNSQK